VFCLVVSMSRAFRYNSRLLLKCFVTWETNWMVPIYSIYQYYCKTGYFRIRKACHVANLALLAFLQCSRNCYIYQSLVTIILASKTLKIDILRLKGRTRKSLQFPVQNICCLTVSVIRCPTKVNRSNL